jgi:hypothetical protein
MTRRYDKALSAMHLYLGIVLSISPSSCFSTKIRYFTLAHEIAHNLVQPHNSEHEFYFSAICEKYLVTFSRVLLQQGS